MRPLYEFGAWSITDQNRDESVRNKYRGDIREGTCKVVYKPEEDDFFNGLPKDLKEVISHMAHIDASDIQYYKVFCLYSLMFDYEQNCFARPDTKLRDFGNSAVIIKDMDVFLRRFLMKLENEYPHRIVFLMNEIDYYDFESTKQLNPLFSKTLDYAWQNELRIAIGFLDVDNKYLRNPNGKYPIIRSLDRLTINIGDISDITERMTIDDFLKQVYPPNYSCKFAMSTTQITMFENIINDTKKIMKERKTILTKPMLTIS